MRTVKFHWKSLQLQFAFTTSVAFTRKQLQFGFCTIDEKFYCYSLFLIFLLNLSVPLQTHIEFIIGRERFFSRSTPNHYMNMYIMSWCSPISGKMFYFYANKMKCCNWISRPAIQTTRMWQKQKLVTIAKLFSIPKLCRSEKLWAQWIWIFFKLKCLLYRWIFCVKR